MKQIKMMVAMMLLVSTATYAQQHVTIQVTNPSKFQLSAQPVVVDLGKYSQQTIKSAVVTCDGVEVPSQLDDLNGDGRYDELSFVTDLARKQQRSFSIQLLPDGTPRQYPAQVYADMMMHNNKVKASNKQDLYISSLTVERGSDVYSMLHHHGPAFESNMVAYRIYFDRRQTVDIYGKNRQGLELHDTQFYPDKQQKAAGYGDDILWVGETLGVGTLRGWDGTQPVMLDDLDSRTLRILSRGPVRTVIEVIDKNWNTGNAGKSTVDMTTRYTLYAGHRDCFVDVHYSHPVTGYQFATGIINVKNSTEYSDYEGLRGCWGTDWPVSEKDSAGHKRETVGLGICIPQQHVVQELPANKDNYAFVVGNIGTDFQYAITFCSDNETWAGSCHSAKDWYQSLKDWKQQVSLRNSFRY
jgi:hypothetical protein